MKSEDPAYWYVLGHRIDAEGQAQRLQATRAFSNAAELSASYRDADARIDQLQRALW